MNNSYTIGELMSRYYEREFETIERAVLPVFSAKHKRKMTKIFNIFARNRALIANQSIIEKPKRLMSVRKRFLLAILIIVFLAIATGCVIAFISNSFSGSVYSDNTHVFAFEIGDSPNVIEEEYVLAIVPEGYGLFDITSNSNRRFVIYKNCSNQELVFSQIVKSDFNAHINTEGFSIQETNINSCNAIYVEFVRPSGTETMILWDNDYYILMLDGDFTKDELIDLAICNEKEGF